jgi:hypothetical protein
MTTPSMVTLSGLFVAAVFLVREFDRGFDLFFRLGLSFTFLLVSTARFAFLIAPFFGELRFVEVEVLPGIMLLVNFSMGNTRNSYLFKPCELQYSLGLF